jgi:hypothetical protein
MTRPDWHIRAARPADRAVLESFTCADPKVFWQAEVEQFIQKHLIEWAFDPHAAVADPQALLVCENVTRDLVGVAAHEREVLQGGDGVTFNATKLEVVAISARWQGRRFNNGVRASDVLMSAVMADVANRVPPRDARVFAVVHEDNVRSLRLCRRFGLVDEMSRPHPAYRRIVTEHRR